MYNKMLIEQKEEMQELKRNFTNLNHQIRQLKNELAAKILLENLWSREKDQAFLAEHFNVDQVDKDVLIIRGTEHNSLSYPPSCALFSIRVLWNRRNQLVSAIKNVHVLFKMKGKV